MVNTAIDSIRKNKNHAFQEQTIENLSNYMEISNFQEHNFDELTDEQRGYIILDAIQKLSPAYRTTLNLYVFDELSHKEISEKLGISIGSSKSNLAKARVKLQELLKNKLVNGAA